ncbi:MAG TPA: MlaD family protein [Thermoanaerobaculia bacterium]|nr:MlaD family protein [Thermoanaerobaculia bacterium]
MSNVIKVGLFATVCLIILAFLIWQIEDINPFKQEGSQLSARFATVAGLDDKAPVRVAGVRVGRVDGITLDGRQARVRLVLDQPLDLPVGTVARISSLGLLGDKYIELIPGPAGGPPLPPDAVLPGTTPPSFDEAMAKLNQIGDSIQQVTGSLGGSDLGGNINRLIEDVVLTSREIRLLVAENRANVASAVRNFDQVGSTLATELPRLSNQMNRTLDQIARLVEDNRGNFDQSLENVRDLTSKLQTSADNLNAISGKIASGEGTIGKLVNDDEAYNEVISTLDSIQGGVETLSGTIGAISRFRIDLDMQAYVLSDEVESPGGTPSRTQTSFHLDIDPQDNKRLYRVGLSSTPYGDRKEKQQTITVTNPDGSVETTTIDTLTEERSYVMTGLFGYQAPRDLRLWAGIIEDSGGAQVDYPLFDRRLWLTFQAFDFGRPQDQDPHLRLQGRYQFHPNLYLVGGWDDPLENNAIFLGGGIRWNDENIKYLLGAAGGALN